MKTEKTICPLTAEQFANNAQPLVLKCGDQVLTAEVKQFSTGSFGWYINQKLAIEVDGKIVSVQVGANLIVANSKEADRK